MVDPNDRVAIDFIPTKTTPAGIVMSRKHRAPVNSRSYRIPRLTPTSFFPDHGCHVHILEEAHVLRWHGHRSTIVTRANGNPASGLASNTYSPCFGGETMKLTPADLRSPMQKAVCIRQASWRQPRGESW